MNRYRPMLAQACDSPFSSEDWIFEIKWDGIRGIAYVNDKISIRSRNDKELITNFPELRELNNLTRNVVLDGEIIVMRNGKADFQTLLERSQASNPREIGLLAAKNASNYVVFDILEKDGKPTVDKPLLERKKILSESVKEGNHVIVSVYVEKNGEAYYRAAVQKGVEGVMAKRKDGIYEPGIRTSSWLKIKQIRTCDCALFGYTKGEGARALTFGALILGLYDRGKPVFVGKVGTGFSDKTLDKLMEAFKPLETQAATLSRVDISEKIVWLRPELVCEVAFQAVTKDRKLRAPRFRGLRLDKHPEECTADQLTQGNLTEYASKRNFSVSSEPEAQFTVGEGKTFVVQEHHSRRLHFDLRLEKSGVLKSWAVPKGIPQEIGEKRLAVETEDHPLAYSQFEGAIPKGQYGAGTVKIWDRGTYEPKVWTDDFIEFTVTGNTLQGRYVLTRFKKAGENQWLLLKARD